MDAGIVEFAGIDAQHAGRFRGRRQDGTSRAVNHRTGSLGADHLTEDRGERVGQAKRGGKEILGGEAAADAGEVERQIAGVQRGIQDGAADVEIEESAADDIEQEEHVLRVIEVVGEIHDLIQPELAVLVGIPEIEPQAETARRAGVYREDDERRNVEVAEKSEIDPYRG